MTQLKPWDQIQGHDRVKSLIERAFNVGRLHHAYLLTGIAGIGKETTALSLAAIINCKNRSPETFERRCKECTSCRKIRSGSHPDIIRIKPSGNTIKRIKIDQIRDIEKEAAKQPYEGRSRIVILDGAHFMTEEAANALLKTLEEPTTEMMFFLTSERPNALLDTIRSRCQRLRFGALSEEQTVAILKAELGDNEEAESQLDQKQLQMASRYAEGSPGQALEVIESNLLERRDKIFDNLGDLDLRNPTEIIDFADDLTGKSDELAQNIDVIRLFLRDVIVYQKTSDKTRLINEDMVDQITEYAESLPAQQILEHLDSLEQDQQLIERRVKPRLIAEEVGFRLAATE